MKRRAEGRLDGTQVEVINSKLLWKQRLLPQEHLAAFQKCLRRAAVGCINLLKGQCIKKKKKKQIEEEKKKPSWV